MSPVKPRAQKRKKSLRSSAISLGPGLHGGALELVADGAATVRLFSGDRVSAVVLPHVDPGLVMACLRKGTPVILVDSPRGPAIAGALQTSLAVERDRDGQIVVDARDIRLRAARSLVIEAGAVTVSADDTGALRMEGDRMILDMAALVRVLSSRVELP